MFLAAEGNTEQRGPTDDFWYMPTGVKTAAGVRVNDEMAMRLAVLYACVNVVAQDLAKVPLNLYRRLDNGGRERVTDHPVVQLLRAPARGMTSMDWKQRLQGHQLLRGNGMCEIRTDLRGRIRELPPLRPSFVDVELMSDQSLRYHVRDEKTGTERILVEGEVLHFRGLSLDGPLGLSPIDQMRESLGEAIAAQSYAATFFANDARPSIWLKHPNNFKDEDTRRSWLAQFKRAFGGANRFSPMLTEYGIEIEQLEPLKHSDMQFLELRKLKANEICAIYRVPPHKVALLERSTNNNIEHQGIEYVTDCLLTWCRRWEERLALDLLTEDEQDELYFEFNLDALMRGDMKTRFEAYNNALGGAPWIKRNEVRSKENLEPVDGGDKIIDPLNMAKPGALGKTPAKPPTPAPQQDDDDEEKARARALELQARRRVLNRETRALSKEWERAAGDIAAFREAVSSFYAYHLPFVSQALAIDAARAEAYCVAQCDEIERAIAAAVVPAMLVSWEADAKDMSFSPLPAAQPPKGTP